MRKEILAFLRDHQYDINIDIIQFIKISYSKVLVSKLKDILIEMQNDSVITEGINWQIFNLLPESLGLLENFAHKIVIGITEKGLKELEEYELRQRVEKLNSSVIETNISIKKMNDTVLPDNFRIQKKLTLASIIVSASSALFVLASIFVSIILSDSKTPKILQMQAQELDSLKQIQRQIDSSIQRLIKPSKKK